MNLLPLFRLLASVMSLIFVSMMMLFESEMLQCCFWLFSSSFLSMMIALRYFASIIVWLWLGWNFALGRLYILTGLWVCLNQAWGWLEANLSRLCVLTQFWKAWYCLFVFDRLVLIQFGRQALVYCLGNHDAWSSLDRFSGFWLVCVMQAWDSLEFVCF